MNTKQGIDLDNRCFTCVSKKWNLQIIMTMAEGLTRYNELCNAIPTISTKMLSIRLKELSMEGLISREVFNETPVKIEYHLTEKGKDFHKVVTEYLAWLQRWEKPKQELMAFSVH